MRPPCPFSHRRSHVPRTHSALSFLLLSGPADKALEWSEQLTADQRTSVKADYVAAGISLIVSAFGSTDAPTSTGADPTSTANTMAAWVKEFDLDGIDVDYEVRPAGGRCTFFPGTLTDERSARARVLDADADADV